MYPETPVVVVPFKLTVPNLEVLLPSPLMEPLTVRDVPDDWLSVAEPVWDIFRPDSMVTLPELMLNVPPEVIARLELILAVPVDKNVTLGSGARLFQEVKTFPSLVKLIVKFKSCVNI